MIAEIRRRYPSVTALQGDCQKHLPYPNCFFDRAVAVHVFEHLPDLPAAVSQLYRILKPGAILSLVLPCDPGIAYAAARKISAERLFKKRFDMPYDWLIRREHINSPQEILSVLHNGFSEIDCEYFPLRIPVMNANLVLGVSFRRT